MPRYPRSGKKWEWKANETPMERLERNIQKTESCWLWTGCKNPAGYGLMGHKNRRTLAHRWMYELTHGLLPPDMHVCHRCDNPSCVRPEHLFLGTNNDNMQDKCRKGRQPIGSAHGMAKLSNEQVRFILERREVKTGEIARRFGVSHSLVSMIRSGKRRPYLQEPPWHSPRSPIL